MCVAAEDSYYILQYKSEVATEALSTNEGIDEDGIEAAFDVVGEIEETVKTGLWVGDCLIYTNSVNRLNYYVGGEIVTISHLDRLPIEILSCSDSQLSFCLTSGHSMYLATSLRTIVCTWVTRNWVWSAIHCSLLCWNTRLLL